MKQTTVSKHIDKFISTVEPSSSIVVQRFVQKRVRDFFLKLFVYLGIAIVVLVGMIALNDLDSALDSGATGEPESNGGFDFDVGFANDYSEDVTPGKFSDSTMTQCDTLLAPAMLSVSNEKGDDLFGRKGYNLTCSDKSQKLFPLKSSASTLSTLFSKAEAINSPLILEQSNGHSIHLCKKSVLYCDHLVMQLSTTAAEEILQKSGVRFTRKNAKREVAITWKEQRNSARLKDIGGTILFEGFMAAIVIVLMIFVPAALPLTVPIVSCILILLVLRNVPSLYLSIVAATLGLRSKVILTWDDKRLLYRYKRYWLTERFVHISRRKATALFTDRTHWASWSGGIVLNILTSRKEQCLQIVPDALNSKRWNEFYSLNRQYLITTAVAKLLLRDWGSITE